ncbi:metal-dependent hydrolase family protein [Convivina intestini]|uniref:metal-dependent hydrolase family protein n=1 Tax=Convivina intestini TaxID=1505726 RepID=UPI00200E9BC7|nr:amidohydrolase family protein [Convivina intestini]CAH1855841.1 hypothetical protein R078131_01283 [Convivina intestini]
MVKIKFENARVFTGKNTSFAQQTFCMDTDTGYFIDGELFDKTIDLTGKFVMPGMINAHTHIILDAMFEFNNHFTAVHDTVIAIQNLKRLLAHGVTYIRDVGSTFDIDLILSKLEQENELLIPGIIGSGGAIMMTGGHGRRLGIETDGLDDIRKQSRINIKKGARNIKLMATGGVSNSGETPHDVQLGVEEMRVAVEEAHHKGYTAAAHAQGNQGIKNAIKAGVDSIEHGIFMDKESIQMMLEFGTYLVPTMIAPWAINSHAKQLPDFMVDKSLAITKPLQQSLKESYDAGVKIAMGTDAGTPFNDFENGSAFELQLMVEAGMSEIDVLKAATMNGAMLLHVDEQVGSIEPDKLADFIILNEDPLANIKAVQGEKTVYKKAQLVKYL